MAEWVQTGLLASILAIMLIRWVREDWAMWQRMWFRVKRRVRR